MNDETLTDVSSPEFEPWIKFVFDHPVIKYPGDSWYWSSGERFVATNPQRLLEHFTRLCLDFPEIASRYTLQQIDQGIWFLLSEPIHSGEYLVLATIPLDVRLECIRSMYHVYSDFVAKTKVAVMENGFDMWWDLVCGDCWSGLKHSPPKRNIEECVGGYEKLTTDEKAILDTIYETMAKILKLKEQRCTAFALHGLGHLHHPLGRNLVQKFINDNRRDFTPDGIKWLESCRDGTVM